jgi:hypothetical protein
MPHALGRSSVSFHLAPRTDGSERTGCLLYIYLKLLRVMYENTFKCKVSLCRTGLYPVNYYPLVVPQGHVFVNSRRPLLYADQSGVSLTEM